ncbi:MAG TPA: response regulator, partial [Rhizomicrobium sp.]|nr:response regulator [Rhizomicrobium sp.]
MIKEEAKPHILLVEDARDIREPLARYFREHNYRATTAQDAASARKVMKGAAIDLVVLDIMMPGEDGLSLCRSIRETTQIPVILLTARGEEVDRIIGLEMGADDY